MRPAAAGQLWTPERRGQDGIDLEDVEARTARRESDVPREPRVRISKLLSAEELVQRRAALNHSRSAAESL